MYRRKNFVPRLLLVLFAVILMGFCLSWLVLCDMGTDPCTMMNLAISDKLGMAIGDWQALMNIVLLIFVIIFGGRNLGFGTLASVSSRVRVAPSAGAFAMAGSASMDKSIESVRNRESALPSCFLCSFTSYILL